MSLISWNTNLSVQIVSIDEQHKELMRIMNELNDAMGQGKANDVLGNLLDELILYTVFHFSKEEGLFDKYGYPEAVAHKELHKLLVEKVKRFQKEFLEGASDLSEDLMMFLKEWLLNHIVGNDKKYTPFLKAKGET
ncbi:MAG: hemerythrin family protein [Fibrobacteria bacterium]|nr:hemerythrin family protein [Fibrobacteria bacterium]